MSQGSPSAQRVISIVNFFADHPWQAFTLTDLVRALRLSRATAHAFLTTLADAGYLFRASDKSYVLGPALASIGDVARQQMSPLQVAQPELRRLADEFDVVCSAVFREGKDIVVRDRATSRSSLGFTLPRGGRLPLRPPFGGIYFVNSLRATEDWLAALDPPATPDQREETMAGIAFAARYGFQLTVRTLRDQPTDMSSDWLFVEAIDERPVLLATSLEADRTYQLASVTAPVMGAADEVVFVLTLVGFTGTRKGAEIAAIGQRMCEAARRLTGFLGGRNPSLDGGGPA